MALSDASGTVLAANPAYFELYGCAPDEVLGRHFAWIYPAEQRASAQAQYESIFNSPTSRERVGETLMQIETSALRIYTIEDGIGIKIAGPAPRAEGLLTGLARPLPSEWRDSPVLVEPGT